MADIHEEKIRSCDIIDIFRMVVEEGFDFFLFGAGVDEHFESFDGEDAEVDSERNSVSAFVKPHECLFDHDAGDLKPADDQLDILLAVWGQL